MGEEPSRVGRCRTVDAIRGEVMDDRAGAFTLWPVAAGLCPECATAHASNEPHNQQSLLYQYLFFAQHGRWPTWTDALAHCGPEVRRLWVEQLVRLLTGSGQHVPPDLQNKPAGS
jgi:hypothetical protein